MKYTIDATNKVLGRVASEAARVLLGKNSSSFQKNTVADVVVEIINAGKMKISDKKVNQKKYTSYSLYPGGFKARSISMIEAKHGIGKVVISAVNKMLPKNRLQAKRIRLLEVKE